MKMNPLMMTSQWRIRVCQLGWGDQTDTANGRVSPEPPSGEEQVAVEGTGDIDGRDAPPWPTAAEGCTPDRTLNKTCRGPMREPIDSVPYTNGNQAPGDADGPPGHPRRDRHPTRHLQDHVVNRVGKPIDDDGVERATTEYVSL